MPLIEGGDLPIEDAFVGRDREREFINSLFESSERVCLAVLGNVGVGKTSLANFQKFIWKYSHPKLLFSFRREIEACDALMTKDNFLIEIIGSVLREIRLIDPDLLQHELLIKLSQIVDVTQSANISASVGASFAGFGGNIGGSNAKTTIHPIKLSTVQLTGYFEELVQFIKNTKIKDNKYSGLVIHVNNFDVVLEDPDGKKRVGRFFNEIRDLLQTKDTYFLFLGPDNFFKDVISPHQRVKSIFFPNPLKVSPLSKNEIVQAFNERMNLLQSEDIDKYIKPIADEVVYKLYDLYEGDIRSIMNGITKILGQCSDKLTQPLTLEDSMLLLAQEMWDRIDQTTKLTPEQKEVLKFIIKADRHISQKDASELLKQAQSNISGYYFKPLKEAGIIEEKGKDEDKKTTLWGLSSEFTPLMWLVESQKKNEEVVEEKAKQLSLFEEGA